MASYSFVQSPKHKKNIAQQPPNTQIKQIKYRKRSKPLSLFRLRGAVNKLGSDLLSHKLQYHRRWGA